MANWRWAIRMISTTSLIFDIWWHGLAMATDFIILIWETSERLASFPQLKPGCKELVVGGGVKTNRLRPSNTELQRDHTKSYQYLPQTESMQVFVGGFNWKKIWNASICNFASLKNRFISKQVCMFLLEMTGCFNRKTPNCSKKHEKTLVFCVGLGHHVSRSSSYVFLRRRFGPPWPNTSASHITSTSWLLRSPAMSAKVSSAAKMTKTCASFKFQVAKGYPKTTIDLRSVNINRIYIYTVHGGTKDRWKRNDWVPIKVKCITMDWLYFTSKRKSWINPSFYIFAYPTLAFCRSINFI